jgi:hypothetical protein
VTTTIKALWKGELPLAVAFWHYAIVWGLVINIVTSVMTMAVVLADAPAWVLVPVYLLPTPYNILVLVGVWQSAARYEGPRKWADLARLVTLVEMAVLTVT